VYYLYLPDKQLIYMNIETKDTFLRLWKKYFGDSELPIVFYYTEGDGGAEWAEKQKR